MPKAATELSTAPIRVDKETARKLRIIASIRGTTIGKLLEPILQPFLEREFSKAVKDISNSE